MTAALRLAERLLGTERCVALLDGSPEQAAQLAAWYPAAHFGAPADHLLALAMGAFHAVLDDPAVLAWWRAAGNGKPGLPAAALRRGCCGVMRVEVDAAGHWIPADLERGAPAVLWCETAGAPARALDVVAMNPRDPAQWAVTTGFSTILPHPDVPFYFDEGDVCRLYEHPLGWLAGGAAPGALCVLDWRSRAAVHLLDEIDAGRFAVVCDSAAHLARVRALARPRRARLRLLIEAGRAAAPALEAAPLRQGFGGQAE